MEISEGLLHMFIILVSGAPKLAHSSVVLWGFKQWLSDLATAIYMPLYVLYEHKELQMNTRTGYTQAMMAFNP